MSNIYAIPAKTAIFISPVAQRQIGALIKNITIDQINPSFRYDMDTFIVLIPPHPFCFLS